MIKEKIDKEHISQMMLEALKQASIAAEKGEVPVGAVIVRNNEVIATAHNEIEQRKDASAHAEVLAIQAASKKLGDWRLTDVELYVTLEPCTMCMGAIKLARIPVVIYAASDPRLGACSSLFNLADDSRLGPVPRVISGIAEEESIKLLQGFFKNKR